MCTVYTQYGAINHQYDIKFTELYMYLMVSASYFVPGPLILGFLTIKSKEEKRVLNALYAPCKVFSENHVPGIQTLTNEST